MFQHFKSLTLTILSHILLTGATGGLGSRVLYHLLHTLSAPPSSLLISTPRAQPQNLDDNDVEVRQGDFHEPKTLTPVFAGAAVLFLVSYPSIAHSSRVEAHINAIDAAIRAGVKHIFYTSLAFASDSRAEVMRAHIDTEDYLRHTCARSGCRYTVVREGIYSGSYPLYLGFFDAKTQAAASKRNLGPRNRRLRNCLGNSRRTGRRKYKNLIGRPQ